MTQFPFQIKINSLLTGRIETVECRALLRSIPGIRAVYDAAWQDRPVIVKVFSSWFNAPRHLKREWQGLNSLKKLKINSPEPLFFGKTDDGQWAIVTEKIVDSFTARELFSKTARYQTKLDLLNLVCKELVRKNEMGILQKDLHLGNFLIKDNEVYTIDPAQMRFFSRPLTRSESISQLAILACSVPEDDELVKSLAEQYFSERCWKLGKKDVLLLKRKMASHRKKINGKSIKKTLRTGTGYRRIRIGRHSAVFDRDFIGAGDPYSFLEQIDSLMDAGQILKKGNTSYVSTLVWNNHKIVIKRYNYKGFIYSLRITLKGSRARHCWLCGHLLSMLNIPTPKPLAFIELNRGPILWQSYLVTEFVEGRRLYDCLQQANKEQQSKIALQIRQLLDKLGQNRITHGDLKPTNILITKDGPVLTDLDAMKSYKWSRFFRINQFKDTARLCRSNETLKDVLQKRNY